MVRIREVDVPSVIGRYALLEITFQLDTVATNLQMPFDPAPPPGVVPSEGVTVDAILTDPNGISYSIPAFYRQEYDCGECNGHDWIYPSGRGCWIIRFSPDEFGDWLVKIVAEDASGIVESPMLSFVVEEFSYGVGRCMLVRVIPAISSMKTGHVQRAGLQFAMGAGKLGQSRYLWWSHVCRNASQRHRLRPPLAE